MGYGKQSTLNSVGQEFPEQVCISSSTWSIFFSTVWPVHNIIMGYGKQCTVNSAGLEFPEQVQAHALFYSPQSGPQPAHNIIMDYGKQHTVSSAGLEFSE